MISAILPYMPKKLVWLFSKKYIAGISIDDALQTAHKLNESNSLVTIDALGEFIEELSAAEANKNFYIEIIERAEQEKVKGNYSLKPTMFGLLLDKEVCYKYIREIVAKAAEYNNFVRIDMEDSQCVDLEIDIYKRIKTEFPENVGLVVQAYLKRTFSDLEKLMEVHSTDAPLDFRICKGIYVEPEEISYKKYEAINENYLKDLEFMFEKKVYVGIATHDKKLVEGAYQLIEKHKVPKDMYEFQMLYGVTPDLRKSIIAGKHKMRIYIPFGEDWFGYSTRRLKENPKMAGHIIKALFIRG